MHCSDHGNGSPEIPERSRKEHDVMSNGTSSRGGNIMPNSKWNYLNHKHTISGNHFHSKLAGSLVTLFVKYFHYLEWLQLYVAHYRMRERAYESKTSHNWFYIESRKHNLMYSSTNYSQSNYISVTFLHLILEALFNNIKSMKSSNALCTLCLDAL